MISSKSPCTKTGRAELTRLFCSSQTSPIISTFTAMTSAAERLLADRPDCMLLLAWNFFDVYWNPNTESK